MAIRANAGHYAAEGRIVWDGDDAACARIVARPSLTQWNVLPPILRRGEDFANALFGGLGLMGWVVSAGGSILLALSDLIEKRLLFLDLRLRNLRLHCGRGIRNARQFVAREGVR